MLDSYESGGLNLSTSEYGFIYGTLGVAMLTLGGITGGLFIARNGLKFWIIWMALAMKLPDLVYVYMAHSQPTNLTLISFCVSICLLYTSPSPRDKRQSRMPSCG